MFVQNFNDYAVAVDLTAAAAYLFCTTNSYKGCKKWKFKETANAEKSIFLPPR